MPLYQEGLTLYFRCLHICLPCLLFLFRGPLLQRPSHRDGSMRRRSPALTERRTQPGLSEDAAAMSHHVTTSQTGWY
jgi:hypothetical protein